jgi:hypothetical protein
MNDSIAPSKICKRCEQTLPATSEYFCKDKSRKDGLCSNCKKCNTAKVREWREANPEKAHENRRAYYDANRETALERSRAWAEANPERTRERKREWQQNNAERARETQRAWAQENLELVRERSRIWGKANPERARKNSTKWRKANPEYNRIKSSRRRAKKKSLLDTFTIQEWFACLEYFHHCCAACGCQLRDLFGEIEANADHWIPIASPDCLGTVKENMICLCNRCNSSKSAKDPEQWLTERFGKKKAKEILKRVKDYFESIA